ncbi:BRO-N domain-containing protein [Acinetobacter larvae]|uniref:Phage antirepressor protein n=1 Tax=Acinetobacter larvae TaxID=1789224 RepID=A0A1B2LZ55_9GAMM|nr:Bro-N domain-containing protein [Acinetobacter larvae]AOA58230.1 phage antirepressor protein [Acinetobacter larvae]
MANLTQFTFHDQHDIRIIDINGELWFVATDVANALDYRMASDMTRFLDDDEKGTHNLRTPSGSQDLSIINESGLYSAILKSRKPEAKRFKKWVTSEVLPAIRKTGKYEAPKPIEKRNYINNNDMLNLKRLIWCCAGYLDHKRSFTNAVYHSLRHVTGVPSPAKFEVEHLPAMAQEFQRILNIIEPYIEVRRECETKLIKRLLLNRGDSEGTLSKWLDDMKKSAFEADQYLQSKLPLVFNEGCMSLLQRNPAGTNMYDGFEELA